MSYIYEPEVEEEEGGYSIPKILVAILLLILVGAGIYIYVQQKKLTTSITYLLDSKKQVEQDLNQMIEKYNLAIDDNGSLEDDLLEERDQIIRYRDSIMNVKEDDVKEIEDFKRTISRMKEESAIQFKQETSKEVTATVAKDNEGEGETDKLADSLTIDETISQVLASTEDEEEKSTEPETETKPVEEKVVTSTTFNRVEIPPIYPGCNEGSANEKKACFAKKVKKHLSRKFDSNIIDDLNLSAGKKRVWVHFNIDEFGNIAGVSARGPHKKLEDEATRVIKGLPQMKPASQNGNAVQISYSVPITIMVQ